MRCLAVAILLCAASVCAQDDPLPFNTHEFKWSAKDADGHHYEGSSATNTIAGAYAFAVRELSRLCAKGAFADETDFEITIEWKGKEFKRTRTARSGPTVMPRGPNKDKEAPRGPHAYDRAKVSRE